MADFSNAFPQYPDCMMCRDTGLTLGDEYPWRFCGCVAGDRRKVEQPEAVDYANEVRLKRQGGVINIGQMTAKAYCVSASGQLAENK